MYTLVLSTNPTASTSLDMDRDTGSTAISVKSDHEPSFCDNCLIFTAPDDSYAKTEPIQLTAAATAPSPVIDWTSNLIAPNL